MRTDFDWMRKDFNVSGRSKELKGPQTLSSSACTREKKNTRHKCRGGFGGGWCGKSGHGWCRRVGEDMGNTPPKFGVGGWGVRCGGQSAVKVTEKEIGHIGTRGVRPLRSSQLSLRPALWTISTSGKPLHAHRWTTSPLYRNMEFQPSSGGKQQKKVLLMVLRYCPGSTATR
jgi:hypothetical protein